MLNCHKALLGLSVVGLVLLIIVVASPGWLRVHYIQDQYLVRGDDIIEDQPRAMSKRESEPLRRKHHRYPEKDIEEIDIGYMRVSISAGLWYFVTCVCGKFEDGSKIRKCHFTSYCGAKKQAERLPVELQGLGLESVYRNIGEVAKFGLMEFQVEAAIGLVCVIIGVVFGIKYVRGQFTSRAAGLATFILHMTSGVLFAVMFGKAIGMYKMGIYAMEQYYSVETVEAYLSVPYSLLIAVVASVIVLGCSFVFLLILSKGPRQRVNFITSQGKQPGVPFGVISPPGYQPFPGLSDTKEAEQLPEKKPL